jgi:hypothetical protein
VGPAKPKNVNHQVPLLQQTITKPTVSKTVVNTNHSLVSTIHAQVPQPTNLIHRRQIVAISAIKHPTSKLRRMKRLVRNECRLSASCIIILCSQSITVYLLKQDNSTIRIRNSTNKIKLLSIRLVQLVEVWRCLYEDLSRLSIMIKSIMIYP